VSGEPHKPPHQADDPPPPLLGTWRKMYATVLVYLAILIFVFYLFTRAFDS
jgi:hypothetical protein